MAFVDREVQGTLRECGPIDGVTGHVYETVKARSVVTNCSKQPICSTEIHIDIGLILDIMRRQGRCQMANDVDTIQSLAQRGRRNEVDVVYVDADLGRYFVQARISGRP
jgi:hypothetical protein